MSYTAFELKWHGEKVESCGHETIGKFCHVCGEPVKLSVSDFIRNDDGYMGWALRPDGSTNEAVKWYDYKSDMIEFSKKFPDVTFCLYGSGEDIWRCYFKNGLSEYQKAQIVFDDAPDWAEK